MVEFDDKKDQRVNSDAHDSIDPDIGKKAPNETASKLKEEEEKADSKTDAKQSSDEANINDREQTDGATNGQGGWANYVTPNRLMPRRGKAVKLMLKVAPLTALSGSLIVIIFAISIAFTNAMGPLTIVANVVDDLNYQLTSMNIRHMMLAKNRMATAESKEIVKGCTTLSIRCRFATLTTKDIEAYNKAGIKANYGTLETTKTVTTYDSEGQQISQEITKLPDEKSNGLGFKPSESIDGGIAGDRQVVTTYERKFSPTDTGWKTRLGRIQADTFEFQGKTYTSAEFKAAYTKSPELRIAYDRAKNMKTRGFRDQTFMTRVLKRFGLSMKAGLHGDAKQRSQQLMSRAGAATVDEVKFIEVGDDGKPASGTDKWALETDANSSTGAPKDAIYSTKQKLKAEKAMTAYTKSVTPVGKVATKAAQALGILGIVDMACSIKNTIGAAGIAAKVSNSAQMAKYAMPVLSLAGKMKAGDITAEEASTLGEWFSQTDDRKQVEGVTIDGENGTVILVDNPNYGKSASDSTLYQLSSNGGIPPDSVTNTQYSLGTDQSKLLSGTSEIGATLDSIVPNTSICPAVQNWAVRGAGLVAGVVALVGSSGTSAALQVAQMLALTGAFMASSYMLNSALNGTLITGDMTYSVMERFAAFWGGNAVIQNISAQARGMFPGNAQQVGQYNVLREQTKLDYIAMESQDVSPLDITNEYSFLGVMLKSIGSFFGSSINLTSSISGASSLVSGSLGLISTPQKIIAKTSNPERYTKCNDDQYVEMGIAADVQCNPVYVLPDEDLALDTDEVALYMERNGYVKEGTETGLPEGYTPPKAEDTQSFAMNLIKGFTSQFYNEREYPSGNAKDYALYLDYCAYRALPYGETYEESGAFNQLSIDREWITGKKCMSTTDEKIKYFRIYTFDKSLLSAVDEEDVPEQ